MTLMDFILTIDYSDPLAINHALLQTKRYYML